jgi:hypothetical protein
MHTRLDGDLERWTAHGLITPEQAASISAFEADATAPRSGFLVEALGYVGAALAVGAVLTLAGRVWEDLSAESHVAVLALVAAVLFLGGWMLRDRDEPPLRRLADVLLSGAVVVSAFLASEATSEFAGWRDERAAISGGVAGAIVGGLLWHRRRHTLELIIVVGALFVAVINTVSYLAPDSTPVLAGSVIWVLGVAVFVAGHFNLLVPRTAALVLGSAGILIGSQVVSTDVSALPALAASLSAGGLVLYAIRQRHTVVLALGGLGILVFVPQFVFALFGESIGGPAALFATGVILIAIAVGIAGAHAGDRRGATLPGSQEETARTRDHAG